MIIQDLESKGWKIIKHEEGRIYAKRINPDTGKLAFFINESDKIDEVELMRVWTKLDYHPFTYKIENNKITYFDCLFNEKVKYP